MTVTVPRRAPAQGDEGPFEIGCVSAEGAELRLPLEAARSFAFDTGRPVRRSTSRKGTAVMAVKGPKARALLQALLDALSDLVPDDVDIAVTGHGRGCHLQASRLPVPSQVSRESSFGGAFHLESAPLGLGPWVPFLPRKVAAKLTVQDALETIRETISGVARSPWPGPGYKVRVDVRPSAAHRAVVRSGSAESSIG